MTEPNRPFQFSLRAIFVLTTVVAVLHSLAVVFGRWPVLIAVGGLAGYLGTRRSPSRRSLPPVVPAAMLLAVAFAFCAVIHQVENLSWHVWERIHCAEVMTVSVSLVVGALIRIWLRLDALQRHVAIWWVLLPIAYFMLASAGELVGWRWFWDMKPEWLRDACAIVKIMLPVLLGLMLTVRVALYGMYAGAIGMTAYWFLMLLFAVSG